LAVGTIDRLSGVPAYRQIAEHLRSAIRRGDYPPGSKLPSERQLVAQSGTSNRTVREALALLRSEGLIESRHGLGVFVRRPPLVRRIPFNRFEQARQAGVSLFETEVLEQGQIPTRRLTYVGPTPVSAEVAGRMRILPGTEVLLRQRLMLVNGEPVKITASYFPMDLAAGTRLMQPEYIAEGMHLFMEEELGHRYGRYVEELLARMPTREEAQALQLAPGVPVIRILHTDYDTEDRPLEVIESIFAGDKHVFVTEWPERLPQESPP